MNMICNLILYSLVNENLHSRIPEESSCRRQLLTGEERSPTCLCSLYWLHLAPKNRSIFRTCSKGGVISLSTFYLANFSLYWGYMWSLCRKCANVNVSSEIRNIFSRKDGLGPSQEGVQKRLKKGLLLNLYKGWLQSQVPCFGVVALVSKIVFISLATSL